MMHLGPGHIVWACLLGAIAVASAYSAALLWINRNGQSLTKWVCLLVVANAWAIAKDSAVILLAAQTGKPISYFGYINYQFGVVPNACLMVWFIARVLRAKL